MAAAARNPNADPQDSHQLQPPFSSSTQQFCRGVDQNRVKPHTPEQKRTTHEKLLQVNPTVGHQRLLQQREHHIRDAKHQGTRANDVGHRFSWRVEHPALSPSSPYE